MLNPHLVARLLIILGNIAVHSSEGETETLTVRFHCQKKCVLTNSEVFELVVFHQPILKNMRKSKWIIISPRFGVKINNTWVFPKNNGTLKSSILIGVSIINHPFWGTPIFRNIHLSCHHLLTNSVRILSESTSGFPKAGLGLGRLLRRLWRCLFGLKTPETRRRHPC